MAPALTRRVREALPTARLFVMYGQTEATARLTWLPPERLDEKLGSVGIPVAGVELEVRREDGRARGASARSGEVWVRGPNVMLGYWQDPAATRCGAARRLAQDRRHGASRCATGSCSWPAAAAT